ncbi:PaaI family thioesterase [soil metagenome]
MELDELVASMPFAVASGVRLEAASRDEVRGTLEWSADRCTIGGALHGGAVMTLADSVAAICAFLNLPEGASTSTIESKTNFFRGVRSGAVHVVSRPLHVGRRTIVVQSDLRDDADKRVAIVLQTQAVLAD